MTEQYKIKLYVCEDCALPCILNECYKDPRNCIQDGTECNWHLEEYSDIEIGKLFKIIRENC
jgi:hypothetical protein